MRLLVISDLQREVWRAAPKAVQSVLCGAQPDLTLSRPDLVVLDGDIDLGGRAVAWAESAFTGIPVIYVLGNHEGYGQKIDSLREKIDSACTGTSNVTLLDRAERIFGRLRILGATLWTDFQLFGRARCQDAMEAAAAGMNDYRKIRLAKDGYRRIKPLDTAHWHRLDRAWLQEKLHEPFPGTTVVVTHMPPSGRSISGQYSGELLSAAFASDLEPLIANADLWIHGHIHDSMDYTVNGVRVVCNPLGYPSQDLDGAWRWEKPGFDPNFIVSV